MLHGAKLTDMRTYCQTVWKDGEFMSQYIAVALNISLKEHKIKLVALLPAVPAVNTHYVFRLTYKNQIIIVFNLFILYCDTIT